MTSRCLTSGIPVMNCSRGGRFSSCCFTLRAYTLCWPHSTTPMVSDILRKRIWKALKSSSGLFPFCSSRAVTAMPLEKKELISASSMPVYPLVRASNCVNKCLASRLTVVRESSSVMVHQKKREYVSARSYLLQSLSLHCHFEIFWAGLESLTLPFDIWFGRQSLKFGVKCRIGRFLASENVGIGRDDVSESIATCRFTTPFFHPQLSTLWPLSNSPKINFRHVLLCTVSEWLV